MTNMGKNKKEELPDYTVADMDLDGMPWNTKKPWQVFPGDRTGKGPHTSEVPQPRPMTREERRSILWLTLKAALFVAAVFGGGLLLFILFCVFVWLR